MPNARAAAVPPSAPAAPPSTCSSQASAPPTANPAPSTLLAAAVPATSPTVSLVQALLTTVSAVLLPRSSTTEPATPAVPSPPSTANARPTVLLALSSAATPVLLVTQLARPVSVVLPTVLRVQVDSVRTESVLTHVPLAPSPATVSASTAIPHARLARSLPTAVTNVLLVSSALVPTASRTVLLVSTSTSPPRHATLAVMAVLLVSQPLSAAGVLTQLRPPSTESAAKSVPVVLLSSTEHACATSESCTSPLA